MGATVHHDDRSGAFIGSCGTGGYMFCDPAEAFSGGVSPHCEEQSAGHDWHGRFRACAVLNGSLSACLLVRVHVGHLIGPQYRL